MTSISEISSLPKTKKPSGKSIIRKLTLLGYINGNVLFDICVK